MPRTDIDRAIVNSAAVVKMHLAGPCNVALSLLAENLPQSEEVIHLASGAPTWVDSSINSVFAITSRRLLFVSPSPQVLSFDLTTVDSVQSTHGSGDIGIFHLKAGDAKYQLGIPVVFGDQFERHVARAVAVARLAAN
jgi:hypothetical protein